MKKYDSQQIDKVREGLTPGKIKFDCQYYTGYKPCGKSDVCEGCDHYAPQGRRIVIIKLGALGDVLRTTPLLRAFKALHNPSHITWVTNPGAMPLFTGNEFVDRVMTFDPRNLLTLQSETFDSLFCLDKDSEALALAMILKADEKHGFAMSSSGTPTIFNNNALYALQLALSDPLKFYYNTKTYQEIIFEVCGLEFNNEEYVLEATDQAKENAQRIELNPDATIFGINTGCGGVFKTKQWTVEGFCDLIEQLSTSAKTIQCILLGGEREREFNAAILERLNHLTTAKDANAHPFLIDSGCNNSLEDFTGVVNLCDVVLSSDSLAMHLAIGLRKKTIVIFGPTCHQEIELYGRGEKIVTDFDCSPCYLHTCDKSPTCMQALSGESVFETVLKFL